MVASGLASEGLAGSSSPRLLLLAAARVGFLLAVAAAIVAVGRSFGAYFTTGWGPLGLALVAAAGAFLAIGLRPRPVAGASAASLVALGAWSAASPLWGGLPGDAWKTLDQALLAAAALVLGSMLGGTASRRQLLVLAVLVAVVAQATEVLVRTALAPAPETWFHGRFLDGPVGYHNAQAGIFLAGLTVALWLVSSSRRRERLAGGAAAGVLAASLLLTQSRGALAVAGIAIAAQLLLTRSVRLTGFVIALAVAGAALVAQLREVDAALVDGTTAASVSALRGYAVWAGVAAAFLALAAVPDLASRWGRRAVAGALAACAVAALVATVVATPDVGAARDRLSGTVSELTSDVNPDTAPAGRTRLANASLNGRWDAWRVAWGMVEDAPALGAGQGQFAATWTVERRRENLDLLQPHSLPLELLAELGVPGLLAFAVFAALAVAALVRGAPERRLAAAALASLLALLLQAAVDWTWSFPGLVAPTLLVVGAAAGAGRPARMRAPVAAAAGVLALAALASVALPYLAARHVARADDLAGAGNVSRAWNHADSARVLNPWDAEAAAASGRAAEAAGRFALAAERYREAGRLTQRSWVHELNAARTLELAGDPAGARAACLRAAAANPAGVSCD